MEVESLFVVAEGDAYDGIDLVLDLIVGDWRVAVLDSQAQRVAPLGNCSHH